MTQHQPNNPLHGVTLSTVVEHLFETYGWEELGKRIRVRCFTDDPSVKSSLKFLRKTAWARKEVEQLYLHSMRQKKKRFVWDYKNKNQRTPDVDASNSDPFNAASCPDGDA